MGASNSEIAQMGEMELRTRMTQFETHDMAPMGGDWSFCFKPDVNPHNLDSGVASLGTWEAEMEKRRESSGTLHPGT